MLALLVNDPDLDPYQLIEDNNWWLLNDVEILTRLCREELDNNPTLVWSIVSIKSAICWPDAFWPKNAFEFFYYG